jgi:hypothetical protein
MVTHCYGVSRNNGFHRLSFENRRNTPTKCFHAENGPPTWRPFPPGDWEIARVALELFIRLPKGAGIAQDSRYRMARETRQKRYA